MKKSFMPITLTTNIILMILISSICYAAVVYDEKVPDNTPFYINGVKHVSKYYPAAEKASIAAGENRILVAKGDCQTIEDMQYCVDDAEFGYDDDTGASVSTIDLRVMEFGPEVEIDRDVSTDNPMLNGDVEVTVTLTNVGTERAIGINFEDRYPAEVKMQGSTVNRAFNQAEWSGALDPGKSQSFTYTLTFEDFIEYKSKAKVTYPYKEDLKTVYSDETSFTVARPYTVNTTLNGRSFAGDDVITYTVSIKNKGEDLLRVDPLKINIPEGFIVVKRDVGIEGTDRELTWTGELSKDSSQEFEIKIKTIKKGEFEIKTDFDLMAGKHQFTDTTSEKFRVGVAEIEASVTMEPAEVKAGGELMAEVKLHNLADRTINVDTINYESNWGEIGEKRGWRNKEIEPGKNFYALNKILYAPIVYEEKDYKWTISGHYTSDAGKKFEFSDNGTLHVLPFEKVVDFEETYFVVNQSEDYQYLNMTVVVKNVKDYAMTELNIVDGLPIGARMVAGARDLEGDKLNPGDEVSYSYVFRMSPDATNFTITHTFNAVGPDEEKLIFEMPEEIDMVGDKEEIEDMKAEAEEETANATESNSNNESVNSTITEEKDDEEKKGIFSRMWGWIKGLF